MQARAAAPIVLVFVLVAALGCEAAPAARSAPDGDPAAVPRTAGSALDADAERLQPVVAVHGGAGPWVVAGYRMGLHALARLGLERGSFAIEVTHLSPREVQYSCIADGAAAATGASLGKLNLSLTEAPADEMRTLYRNRKTGQSLALRTSSGFRERFAGVPRGALAAAGREVLHLRDEDIFEAVEAVAPADALNGNR